MDIQFKATSELSSHELTQIFLERVKVFIVEQNCPYQEVDEADFDAIHVVMRDEEHIAAYARILDQGTHRAIGRVLVPEAYRNQQLSYRLMEAIMDYIPKDKPIRLSAQTYITNLYEQFDFVKTSEPYLEDDIPHVDMEHQPTD